MGSGAASPKTRPRQALHVPIPIIGPTPGGGGSFSITLGLEKSTDLVTYDPFPFTLPAITITPEGKIAFKFTPTDNAAFFRFSVQ